MICLVLTLFANVFQSAFTGVNERTFLAIKPDGVQRHLIGEIIRRFEKKGFKLVGMKLMQASEDLLKEHYVALHDRPFYSHLVKYMKSGPVVAMVWQGLDVVKTARTMIGETNPADSRPGTIRGDFCIEVSKWHGFNQAPGCMGKEDGALSVPPESRAAAVTAGVALVTCSRGGN
ncbi:nucleoside diphosphate kinase 3 isoform X1 [Carettochelys insculpta]|uniref:nucleoside diphosphate kinase 3 isoform X1 n=1 Tax=Carettochelys insculpta TaxID=44489 RepID=UPI003EBBC404